MAEVHLIGQLAGATGFDDNHVFCKFWIVAGQQWRLIEGAAEGRTHIDLPEDEDCAVWCHPIDVHYATSTLQGWPKFHCQVWRQDRFGRNELAAYGQCHIPSSPGMFDVECVTWRPLGTVAEETKAFFLGGTPQLKSSDLVTSGGDRFRLRTVAMGAVHLKLGIMLKDFDKHSVKTH
eukprot:GFYU01001765.1.p1 GENE.GFYU01001765.1~~GFYU01001765.1.p1  ORF type:complete len:177 (+),score=25.31 GFYU01001765.1:180-710(+)